MAWFYHITDRSTPSSSINTVPPRPPWRQFLTVEMVWGTYFFVIGIWQNWDTICWFVHLPSGLSKHLLWCMFTHDVSMSISTVREGRGKPQKMTDSSKKDSMIYVLVIKHMVLCLWFDMNAWSIIFSRWKGSWRNNNCARNTISSFRQSIIQ